ncbi:MAG: hypothetical protein ACXV7D_04550 [Thermoanaerobaculia bacterium]
MAKSKNNTKKTAKATVKVQDLSPKTDAKGGRKAGEQPKEFLVIKMNDVIIT